MKILVLGGAGYIGSHMVKLLSTNGYDCVVYDNLSTGHANSARYGNLVIGDLLDSKTLSKLFKDNNFEAVIHFAAASLVGESTNDPSKYYLNNVTGTLNLLNVMLENNVRNIIFSSTAAVFGNPEYTPINEEHQLSPINPYGKSKLMVENILNDFEKSYGLNSVALRYFNACGADPDGDLGEMHDNETHLIPLILKTALGEQEHINIFGTDYPTHDGTCIRDYIHVSDLCSAHLKSLEKLLNGQLNGFNAINLGTGEGFSVKQVLETANNIVMKDNKNIKYNYVERREGDPSILVADPSKAFQILEWQPKYKSLSEMIFHAWQWEKIYSEN